MIKEIAQLIKGLVGHEYLYFDDALIVKMHPHDHLQYTFWATCVDHDGTIYVMDGAEAWWPVEDKEEALIQSLYQRVQVINQKYKAA